MALIMAVSLQHHFSACRMEIAASLRLRQTTYGPVLERAEARGSLAWTLDALARGGGWAEAVEGGPGLTSRGTDGP
jgi:hypothetical protein